MPPNFEPVKSTMIQGVAYDAAAGAMHVLFKNGNRYVYHDVSPEQHAALVGAKSVGRHFAEKIRGQFKHNMVSQ